MTLESVVADIAKFTRESIPVPFVITTLEWGLWRWLTRSSIFHLHDSSFCRGGLRSENKAKFSDEHHLGPLPRLRKELISKALDMAAHTLFHL
jgi:hypothetical protein